MENIKNFLDDRLWNFIKRNYNSENYTVAVQDCIQFIGDLIRDKSGLETDGNNLIGQAFGGKNPKIKLNKLQTETDQNIQKGIESILRGIYSAFRNPRSHTKFEDAEEDADSIIIFINHLLKLIDKSKGKFSVESFIKRVTDKDFVKNDKYAELLIKDVPPKKYFDTAFELYKSKDRGNINNFITVFNKLSKKLKKEENEEILKTASEELRFTENNSKVMENIALFQDNWICLDEDARLRAENKLLNCLQNAKYIDSQINSDGIYSSWLSDIVGNLSLKNEFIKILYKKLSSSNKNEQRFVIECFGGYIEDFHDSIFNNLSKIIIDQLNEGNIVIYNFAKKNITKDDIIDDIKDAINSFNDAEDLPF